MVARAGSARGISRLVRLEPKARAEPSSFSARGEHYIGLAEEIMKHTRSDIFNRILEVQQSRSFACHSPTTY